MTQYEQMMAECEHVVHHFAECFPEAELVTCDYIPHMNMLWCSVKHDGRIDDDNYTCQIEHNDADGYCFRPDDDNEPANMSNIRFRPKYVYPVPNDGSIADDDILTVHYTVQR